MANEKIIWDTLMTGINNPYGVAGLMGNLYAESALSPINLQGTYEKKLGYTDASYTAAVDNGTYTNFAKDAAGYGLAQWTYKTRKANLLKFAQTKNKSIGDLEMQLAFLLQEIKGYSKVWKIITTATSVRQASDSVLTGFEKPKDQSEAVKVKRANYGQKYYDAYAVSAPAKVVEETKKEDTTVAINFDKYIKSTGTHYISNSGSDENKSYHGGKAGDQTGHEWELKKWYNRPWTHVFRYEKDARVGRTLAELGIKAALNNKIGYDQYQRTTYWTQLKAANYDPSAITVACEEDCSAGVAANVKACGYILGIPGLQNVSSGMSSRNTVDQLKKAGFTVMTASKYLTSGQYLLPGDILLYVNHHVAMNITKGSKAVEVTALPTGTSAGENVSYKGKGIGSAVAKSTMNIRSGADTTYDIVGTVKKGASVEVLEVMSNGWYKVVCESATTGFGYTSNRNNAYYTYTENPKPVVTVREPASKTNRFGADHVPEQMDAAGAGEYKITASQAINVRKGPGTEFDVLYALPKSTKVTSDGSYSVSATGVRWWYIIAKVKSITVEGFASEKYLKKV